VDSSIIRIVKLFVLAEKLMDDEAKGSVLTAMSARSNERFTDGEVCYPAIESVHIIYEGTPDDIGTRKLVLRKASSEAKSSE